jgi:hypothetical protein
LTASFGKDSAGYHSPITVAGLYWHFVDVVWIFPFALIYLPRTERSVIRYPPRILLLSWLALLLLLALTVFVAYQPLGVLNTVVALTIANPQGSHCCRRFYGVARTHGTDHCLCNGRLFLARHSILAYRTDFATRPQSPPAMSQ